MTAEVERIHQVRTHVTITTETGRQIIFKLWKRGTVGVSVDGHESAAFYAEDLRVLLETMRDTMNL